VEVVVTTAAFHELLGRFMTRAGFANDAALGAVEGIQVTNQAVQKWRTGAQVPRDPAVVDRMVGALDLRGPDEALFRDAYMRARDPVVAEHFERRLDERDARIRTLENGPLARLALHEHDLLWKLREVEHREPGAGRATWTFLDQPEALPILRAVARVVEGRKRRVNGFEARSPNNGAAARRFFAALVAVARAVAPDAVDDPAALHGARGDPEGFEDLDLNALVARIEANQDEVDDE
jgi:hypothetical protein